LSPCGVEAVVGPPAVRAGDAGKLFAEQRLGLALMAVGSDAKECRVRGERAPERAPAATQALTGLIDVDRRRSADVTEQVIVGLLKRRGRASHERIDRAGGDAGAERLAQQLGSVAAGETVTHRQGRDRRLQAWAEGASWHVARKLGAGLGATGGTAQAVEPMLGEEDRDRGQLRDLMARGLPQRLALRHAEHVAAAAASGPVVDDLIERLDRCQPTTASWMARLGTALAPRRSSLPAFGRPGRILAGRCRRVAGVAVQAPLKIGDAFVLLG
jgi:hypothetical protein